MASTELGRNMEFWGKNKAREAFKAALEDFEKARERMREESEKTWKRWEEERKRFFDESEKQFLKDIKNFDERWITDSIFDQSFDDWKGTLIENTNICEDKEKMEVCIDTTGYNPSELSVNVIAGTICIAGKHEEKSEEGKVMVSREFTRKYSLPRNARPENVQSSLFKNGMLKVVAKKDSA